MALVAGILWTVSLGAIDEWVASPQQQALQIKSTATALGEDDDITEYLWARRGNEFVTVKSLNEQGQPWAWRYFIMTISRSNPTFITREQPINGNDQDRGCIHGEHKKWLNGKETLEILDNLPGNDIHQYES